MTAAGAPPAREHDLHVQGVRTHLVEWGDPAAPPLLLLHGLRSYARTWEPVAARLGHRFRLVAADARGRGDSGWAPASTYTTEQYVHDLEDVVEALGLGSFALLGHSMGGTTALVYTARHPDRVSRLVIEDVGPGSSAASAGADRIRRELAATPRRFPDLDAVRDWWRAARPGITAAALASRVEHTVVAADDGGWRWRFDLDGITAARRADDDRGRVDLWPCVAALRCPTLVVRGAESDFLPVEVAREMARRAPDLRVVDVPGAAHHVHDDEPATFLDAIETFLR